MKEFRVNVAIMIDCEANDESHAEVLALEAVDWPGASVIDVTELGQQNVQPEFDFDDPEYQRMSGCNAFHRHV